MPGPIGITFAPTLDNARNAGRNRQLEGVPLQDAVKLLALRLPRVLGVRSLGPLTAERSQAPTGPESAVLQTLLRGERPDSVPGGAASPAPTARSSAAPEPSPRFARPDQNEGHALMDRIFQELRSELPPPSFIPGVTAPSPQPIAPTGPRAVFDPSRNTLPEPDQPLLTSRPDLPRAHFDPSQNFNPSGPFRLPERQDLPRAAFDPSLNVLPPADGPMLTPRADLPRARFRRFGGQ